MAETVPHPPMPSERGTVNWRAVAEALYLAHPAHHPPLDCRPSEEDCKYCAAFQLYEEAVRVADGTASRSSALASSDRTSDTSGSHSKDADGA